MVKRRRNNVSYVYTTLFQRRFTMMAIISTLLFQINIFERYSRSKIKKRTNFLLRFRHCCWTININDDINYCSTILHVKVRTKYAEVNILKKEVAIKLNIQLASSLNLIWRSVVSLAFLSGWFICIYKLSPILKFMTSFTFGKTKIYKVI